MMMSPSVVSRLNALGFLLKTEATSAGVEPTDECGFFDKTIDGEYYVVTDCNGCAPHEGTQRFYVGVYKGPEHRNAPPADGGILCYRLGRSEATGNAVFRLRMHRGGPIVYELVDLINQGLEINAVQLVARTFSQTLREDLTPDDMERLIRLNRTKPYQIYGVCASRQFVDADSRIDAIISDLTGDPFDPNNMMMIEVAYGAATLAKAAEFRLDRL